MEWIRALAFSSAIFLFGCGIAFAKENADIRISLCLFGLSALNTFNALLL